MDERLVGDLRARRPQSLEDLLHRHGAEIQAMAWLILRDPSEAEEVTADTLLTAWHKIDSLRDPERLRPWLLRIATRNALRRRRGPRGVRWLSLEAAAEVADRPVPVIDRIVLSQALDGLPPRMRAVVALHYVAGLSVPEIADAVGRSQNTVKSQIREGLAKLRKELRDEEHGGNPIRAEEWS